MAGRLGIIAGSGELPLQLIDACKTSGRECFVLTFSQDPNLKATTQAPHQVVPLGAVSQSLESLRKAGVSDLVLAGRVARPSLTSLKPDLAATKLLARLGKAFFSGDDALLRALMEFLESEGFRVVGAQDILKSLLAGHGCYGKHKPGADDEADIAKGLLAARELGRLDIGQAVVVERGLVLGVEGPEGTQALIQRCTALKREKGAGVLVKAKKPTQDERADLPAIGVDTIDALAAGGYAGVAIEAGGALVLARDEVIRRANEHGLFVVGVA